MSTARAKPRVGLTASERSSLVAGRVGVCIKASPHPERVAVRILTERVLQIRDDLAIRTGGKVKTWATRTAVKDENGEVVEWKDVPQEQRMKSVMATIGSMLVSDDRRTATWVCDAVEEALSYVPWTWNGKAVD